MYSQGDNLQDALDRIVKVAEYYEGGRILPWEMHTEMLSILAEFKSSVMTEAAFTMD